jgi:hypothetical protein
VGKGDSLFLQSVNRKDKAMNIDGKEVAYVGTLHGVGLVVEGEMGYRMVSKSGMTLGDHQRVANDMNQKRGILPSDAEALEAGSMFGWHVPAAGRFRKVMA